VSHAKPYGVWYKPQSRQAHYFTDLELLEPMSLFAVYHIERIFVSLSKEKIR